MPQYDILVHKSAKRQLEAMQDAQHRRIVETVESISHCEQPTSHEKCSNLKGQDVYKVRVGDYRVLIKLQKPELKVLKVDRRNTVYRNVDEFLDRVG